MKAILEFTAVPLIITLVGFIAYLFGGFAQPASITNHSVFGLFLSGNLFELYEKPGIIFILYVIYSYIYFLIRNNFLFERYSSAYLYNFAYYFISSAVYVLVISYLLSLGPIFRNDINSLTALLLFVVTPLIITLFLINLFPIKHKKNRTIILFAPLVFAIIIEFSNMIFVAITDYEKINLVRLILTSLFSVYVIKSSYDYLTDKKNKS